jgi:hypothetical protein
MRFLPPARCTIEIARQSSPISPHHTLWADDQEGLLATRPRPLRENPEELNEHVQAGPRVFAHEDGERLPENEIFVQQAPANRKGPKERTQKQSDGLDPVRVLSQTGCGRPCSMLLISNADRVLASHRHS